jgi:dihydroneopterin aldolase
MSENLVGKIAVNALQLHIKKGLYASERQIENHFSVSAEVEYDPKSLQNGTYLDYERLAELLSTEMHKDIQLLEQVAQNCLSAIKSEWPFAKGAKVIIEKLNPAFNGLKLASVKVEIAYP